MNRLQLSHMLPGIRRGFRRQPAPLLPITLGLLLVMAFISGLHSATQAAPFGASTARSLRAFTFDQKLTATGGAVDDYFGTRVAFDGTTLVVGAPQQDDVASNAGAAYVFTLEGDTWVQQAKLTASDGTADAWFGFAVAIRGDTILVGAPAVDLTPIPGQGAAYIFTGAGATWTEQTKLVPSGASAPDLIGSAVALSDGQAFVGAPGEGLTGAVFVFSGSGDTWTEQQKLTASDGAFGDGFGATLTVNGSQMIIGAPAKATNTGAAYVFTASGGTWSQQQKLTGSTATTSDYFGWSMAIDGNTALVGAPASDGKQTTTRSGQVFAYTYTGSTWGET